MKNTMPDNLSVSGTIQKTLMTSILFEGFWDRWIAHGIEKEEASAIRPHIQGVEHWVKLLKDRAWTYENRACFYQYRYLRWEAEYFFRMAGLHYNLIQWLFPRTGYEKRKWFSCCKQMFKRADIMSKDKIMDAVIQVDGRDCFGRIRIPEQPQGCVIIINPIDSSKEELFTYESHFAELGFITVSFDGPGQGETYVVNGFKATCQRWDLFINKVIDFASSQYPQLKIYLFGTSSAATWAIQASRHPRVSKAAAISPVCENDIKMPDYFMERIGYVLQDSGESVLPKMQQLERSSPILLFHGNQDVMVKDQDIYGLYAELPYGKRLIEYENEGHCCNYKLREIRNISATWYLED